MKFTDCYLGIHGKGVAPYEFEWTLEEYKENHEKYEYLCEHIGKVDPNTKIKAFGDFDLTVPDKNALPPQNEIETFVVHAFAGQFTNPNLHVAVARRTTAKISENKWKVSIRVFLVGAWTTLKALRKHTWKLPDHIQVPEYIRRHKIDTTNAFFDQSVYKNDRKMNMVGKKKDPKDRRILYGNNNERDDHYMIQIVDEDWPQLIYCNHNVQMNTDDLDNSIVDATPIITITHTAPHSDAINKAIISSTTSFKKFNSLLAMPHKTQWVIEQKDTGHKAVPQCLECLVNPSRRHTSHNHSALFINKDKSIVKNCFSCGSETLAKSDARRVLNQFNNILLVDTQENSLFEDLLDEMLQFALEGKYLKEEDTGIVYRPIKQPYAYVAWKKPKNFLNYIFLDSDKFHSNPHNIENLIKFLKDYDHRHFGFIQVNPDYLGFRNGVLNTTTLEFNDCTPFNEETGQYYIVRKYFDYEFNHSMETPLFDVIFDYQFTPDVRDFIYACLGRLFKIRDSLGFMLYLLGEPGCGKSVIIEIMTACFNNTGMLSETYETKYGLSYLYDKDLVTCDDLPRDIAKVFPQSIFQTIITNGMISSAVKNKDALQIRWTVPLLFAGNWVPNYIDKGQISRRLLVANFAKNVYNPDTTLKERILQTELPAIIWKCLNYYNTLLVANHGKSVWQFCPEHFLEQQTELKMERNPLFKFLVENTSYKEDGIVPIETVKTAFSQWVGRKIPKLDRGTFGQVNKNYIIEPRMICKFCFNEARKGCCPDYAHNQRTRREMVINMELNTLLPSP